MTTKSTKTTEILNDIKKYAEKKHGKKIKDIHLVVDDPIDEKLFKEFQNKVLSLIKENKNLDSPYRTLRIDLFEDTLLTIDINYYLDIFKNSRKNKIELEYNIIIEEFNIRYKGKNKKQNSMFNELFEYACESLSESGDMEDPNDYSAGKSIFKQTKEYKDLKSQLETLGNSLINIFNEYKKKLPEDKMMLFIDEKLPL